MSISGNMMKKNKCGSWESYFILFLCPWPERSWPHLVIGLSVRPLVCLSVCPLFRPTYKVQYLKFWVVIQLPNLDYKFIYGFLTLHWHHMPLGVGRGQNWGHRDFAIFRICCRQGHPCFTNKCLVSFYFEMVENAKMWSLFITGVRITTRPAP